MNRYISVQIGARRNYAVPSILEDSGMLEALYTDMCADAGIGWWLSQYCPELLRGRSIRRLLDRKVPPTLRNKVKTCDQSTVLYLLKRQMAGNNSEKQYKALSDFGRAFGKEANRKSLGKATHIFSMFEEGLGVLESAKQQGLKTVTEIYISPETNRIIQAERELFPKLEEKLSDKVIESDYYHTAKVCQLTDVFVVPSRFVQKGLESFGVDESKCHIVPYGVSNSWFEIDSKPTIGRVLFVGTAELRKGIHILGQAAQNLAHRGYEFRVAGGVSDTIRSHPMTQSLTFLGRIPRSQIQKEYAHSDIFVLPSLAEGSAEVTYEALAAGLPVITTESSGSVIRDGVEGYILSENNPSMLSSCIEKIVEDRSLRNQLAFSARVRAREFTWDRYSERLLNVLTGEF